MLLITVYVTQDLHTPSSDFTINRNFYMTIKNLQFKKEEKVQRSISVFKLVISHPHHTRIIQ